MNPHDYIDLEQTIDDLVYRSIQRLAAATLAAVDKAMSLQAGPKISALRDFHDHRHLLLAPSEVQRT
jgi:hypothetical protein